MAEETNALDTLAEHRPLFTSDLPAIAEYVKKANKSSTPRKPSGSNGGKGNGGKGGDSK